MDKIGEIQISPGETLDELILGSYYLIQARAGYRFSLDAVLLAHFVDLEKINRVADLGTGNGIIAILLAARSAVLQVAGLELQEEQVSRARRSVALNKLENRIKIIQGDVRKVLEYIPSDSCDLVVSNPPFRKKGEGKISKNTEQAIARHELQGGLVDFVKGASLILSTGSRVAMIQRPERLSEIIELFRDNEIVPSRLRWVHSFIQGEAQLFMIEGIKKKRAILNVLPPLIIYERPGIYTAELLSWYQGETEGRSLDG